MQTLSTLVASPTRVLCFTGKGGMGKTTLACAVSVALARQGKRVLIVSTDPASNLDEVLGTELGEQPRPVAGITGLDAANIDPDAAAREYRERTVGPYRGLLPESALASMEESLSGACTVEIAAFDAFASLLGDPQATAGYDHVIFDTAPTGHTLRLLALPAAWTGFIDTNTSGTSCLGPLAALQEQRALYAASVRALSDPHTTTLVLVARPERTALAEAERTRGELANAGMRHQILALNGVFDAADSDDRTALALSQRQVDALAALPAGLDGLPRVEVPLLDFAPIGPAALARVLDPAPAPWSREQLAATESGAAPLSALVEELESAGRGVIMTMGKGGVGKTTLAAAIAGELARRGHHVHLSTTDPAAHVADAVGDGIPGLSVSRIDPAEQTRVYSEQVMAAASTVTAVRSWRRISAHHAPRRSRCSAPSRMSSRAARRGMSCSTPPPPATACCCSTPPSPTTAMSRAACPRCPTPSHGCCRACATPTTPGSSSSPSRKPPRCTRRRGCATTSSARASVPTRGSSTRASPQPEPRIPRWPRERATSIPTSPRPPRSQDASPSSPGSPRRRRETTRSERW
jgi:TRC40/GET3/ArsA family transport-energizing ATPase